MAAGDLVFGTRTALANISRLHSDSNGVATAFGEIDNTTALALDYHVHIIVPISASATAGNYRLYIVESQDGAEWTDNIDPATDSNYAAYIKDAKLVTVAETIYAASSRAEVEFHFYVAAITGGLGVPPYFGFVMLNNSGQTIPASGADGDSMTVKIATS